MHDTHSVWLYAGFCADWQANTNIISLGVFYVRLFLYICTTHLYLFQQPQAGKRKKILKRI